ncbi:helix-turn-helix transcriptional regulator [Halococcus agarilyticus]|uniref:helix-turn-helix transcriptional regulator n=1 Tax=Halococcus agarilyticus TaxID=1232219 RepID=UPI000677B2D1|nr:hypothetical protein [Halococcus agarilyticus]
MSTTLDNVEFLARSSNRFAALEVLIEGPRDRAELRESIDASSSTVGRVLDDLKTKGWVTQTNHRYEATRTGRLVGTEFARLLDAMEAVEQLQGVVDWLPTEEMDFDVTTLQDAEITTATQSSPFRPTLRMAARLGEADEVRMLAYAAIPQVLTAVQKAVVEGTQTFEAVVTPDLLDAVRDDAEMTAQARSVADADRAAVFCSGDSVPYSLAVADGTLVMDVTDDRRLPRALVETENETAVSWAESVYDSYRQDAEPVSSGRIAV